MYMFPTEYSESGSPPNLNSGTMSALHRIPQIMLLVLCLQLSFLTQLGSPVLLSCPCRKECLLRGGGESYDLVAPDLDTEVRSHATTLSVSSAKLGCQRF